MTIAEMFAQSGALALLGMTVVFIFLIIMVVVFLLAGRVIYAFESNSNSREAGVTGVSTGGIDGEIVAAITVAVKAYHKK
jgi:sodium pump decarboxylase gamma subunit